jgi:tetratricopeptide (TPR) repeat protein
MDTRPSRPIQKIRSFQGKGKASLVAFVLLCLSSLPAQAQWQQSQIAYVQPTQLNAAVQSQPSQMSETLRNQAQAYYQAGQFGQALSLYHQLCSIPGASANDFYWLGEAYAHTDNYASAAHSFEQAMKLDPNNEKLPVRLAESLIGAGQRDRARDVCQMALLSVRNERARLQLSMMIKISSMGEPVMQRNKVTGNGHNAHKER